MAEAQCPADTPAIRIEHQGVNGATSVKTNRTGAVAIALAFSACSAAGPVGSNASNADALTHAAAVKTLDASKLDSLPTGKVRAA